MRARSRIEASSASSRSTGGSRVGELDEEMVYEARAGPDVHARSVARGGSRRSRVIVCSSLLRRASRAGPVLEGRGLGRPLELGRGIGRASREIVALSDARCARTARRSEYHLDRLAAQNLLTFLGSRPRPTTASCRRRPDDRHRAIPRRDRRLARLHPDAVRRAGCTRHGRSPSGARLRDTLGRTRHSRSGRDDGVALHIPETPTSCHRSPISMIIRRRGRRAASSRSWGKPALFGARFPGERGPRAC